MDNLSQLSVYLLTDAPQFKNSGEGHQTEWPRSFNQHENSAEGHQTEWPRSFLNQHEHLAEGERQSTLGAFTSMKTWKRGKRQCVALHF